MGQGNGACAPLPFFFGSLEQVMYSVPDEGFDVLMLTQLVSLMLGAYVVGVVPIAMGLQLVKSTVAYIKGSEYR